VFGFKELLSTGDGDVAFSNYEFSVNAGGASDFREMFAQDRLHRNLWAMPLPSGQESYTTTGKLFNRIKRAMAEQILVGEIASEVNRILKGRGEKLQFSPEKVGHKLKKMGLFSQRVGAAGNGSLLDQTTQVLFHEVAAACGCAGWVDGQEDPHCPICEQNKSLV
jgi:hypothetical protein